MTHDTGESRVSRYAASRGLRIVKRRGEQSQDGEIFLSDRPSAIKVFGRPATFRKEQEAYRRLAALRPGETIAGHEVPRMLDHDETLGAIELSLVTPPFVLDFGKIQLDLMLEEVWPEEVLEERWAYWESLFEPEQWPKVLQIAGILGDRFGIWLEDFHVGNIAFGDPPEEPEDG